MAKVLIIAEHDGQSLNASTARTVSCAAQLNADQVDILVLSAAGESIADQASKLSGVTSVIVVNNAANKHPVAAVFAPQIVEIAAAYTHVFAPSTTFGKDLMPRVAALLGVPQVSDIMHVESDTVFQKPVYAGNAVVTVEYPQGLTVVATVRTASYKVATESDSSAAVEIKSIDAAVPSHTQYIGVEGGESDRPDLQSAARVISGGRGIGSEENFNLIYSLADKLGAAVGASRAAVDANYVPNDMQVGQTGKIIAPDLYIAIGISGAIQHLAGIKDAGTIVAINKDADAPIFEVADIGLVADLFDVVPQLEAALS
jgi:electron transfer flavoprotein alpha subunit